ncbi:thiamine diphosphokinase [Chelativorans sp. Marseille-P2723]|uniref:thiamine diphosphokinase n=1 Tax=Chelativorans sp. Marseille-P2723 TaxID=2709133 RepID=UPI0015701654|nr:thiamine diphosphokinase [Chelativorans sp. Marseille-P2723]
MSRFSILLGGDVCRTPRLLAQIAGTRVVAADSGIQHAALLDLQPELWVGDFDSVGEELVEAFQHLPREVYPSDKAETDGELAIAAALEMGATSLVLVGAFGGERPDHAYLHLAQAVRYAEEGVPMLLSSGDREGWPLLAGERHVFDYEDGMVFSILGFTDLSSLTVEGAKWPLDAVEVPFGSSLTISNEIQGKLAVTLGQGRAMLFAELLSAREI